MSDLRGSCILLVLISKAPGIGVFNLNLGWKSDTDMSKVENSQEGALKQVGSADELPK